MKKNLITLLLLVCMGITEQALAQTEKTFIIAPANTTELNKKGNNVFNVSDYIDVKIGDQIKLEANLIVLPKRHQFLKGLFKSATTFAITNQLNKTLNNNIKGNGTYVTSGKNIMLPLGFSIAAGLPNMLQGLKSKKTYLVYTFYDKNKVPLTTKKILLKKQNNLELVKATTNGFLKIMVIGNSKRVMPSNLNTTITEPKQTSFRGAIAGNFNLEAYGDCQSGGGGGGGGINGSTPGECYAIAGGLSALAFTGYLDGMEVCAGMWWCPPCITPCAIGVTAAFTLTEAVIAYDLIKCLDKLKGKK